MKQKNPTIKQHFVPQFYLKAFANEHGHLHVLDIANKRLGKPRPYQGAGYGLYFYAAKTGVPDKISQEIEKWLQLLESIIAAELPKIVAKIENREHITDDDRHILSVLMSMLWLRSPSMREQLNQMEEDMTKKIMAFYPDERIKNFEEKTGQKFSDEDRIKYTELIRSGKFRLEFNNAHHLRFMTKTLGLGGPGFANMFYGMQWCAYLARGNRRFITTDSPVVEWWPPRQTFYGASFLDRSKFFALTPNILLNLTYPHGSRMFKCKTLFSNEDSRVMVFNILLATHANEFAYSGDQKIVEDLLAGHAKHGPAEIAYIKQYEQPWRIARAKGLVD